MFVLVGDSVVVLDLLSKRCLGHMGAHMGRLMTSFCALCVYEQLARRDTAGVDLHLCLL